MDPFAIATPAVPATTFIRPAVLARRPQPARAWVRKKVTGIIVGIGTIYTGRYHNVNLEKCCKPGS
jgi:hypothetical protein